MTLTQVATITKRTIAFLSLFLVFLLVSIIFWKAGFGLYRKIFPSLGPKPTVSFGKLPAVSLPGLKTENIAFLLQTPTGELPRFPSSVNVFPQIQGRSSFSSLEEAEGVAKRLGFTGKKTALSDVIYRFEHPREPSNFDINIVNKTFSLSFDVTKNKELLILQPRSSQMAIESATSLLSRIGFLTEDLASGEVKEELLKFKDGDLVPALSLSEANFVKVHFFRSHYPAGTETVELLPVKTQSPSKANVWFLVSGDSAEARTIIAGEYHYFPLEENSSTYPIKTAKQAWDELVAGGGSVVSGAGAKTAVIRRVYLAYYDPPTPEGFMQPVAVFEGDEGFVAYIPAITQEYYQNE